MSDIDELKKRVAKLEYQVGRLSYLADRSKHPFTFDMLEANLDEAQVDAILELVEDISKQIRAGNQPHRSVFERAVYNIVPEQHGSYHFTEGIIKALNDSGQYQKFYRYMRQNGMNI